MATDDTLSNLIESAKDSQEARWVSPLVPSLSGIDPLGMRQTNFDLMDKVLPGLNNTARHIRPFTVVAWAWWKAARLASATGRKKIAPDLLVNFVDRIEVVFAWSQFVRSSSAELPGRNVLAPLINAERYKFGGALWKSRRRERRYSTALSAPVNYGPSLKNLGWIGPHGRERTVFIPNDAAIPAIEALDVRLQSCLDHPLFTSFDEVTVEQSLVDEVGEAWAMERLTEPERRFVRDTLVGELSRPVLKQGISLVSQALRSFDSEPGIPDLRRTMAEPDSGIIHSSSLVPTSVAWKVIQLRQVFRLAMESLLHWAVLKLRDGTHTTAQLTRVFVAESGSAANVAKWLASSRLPGGPVDWLSNLQESLADGDTAPLAKSIRATIASLSAEPLSLTSADERQDRLPLSKAVGELQRFYSLHPVELLAHVIERWVFGQHVYWALGRGLSDARGNQRRIFRLKVALEEAGWTLTSGTRAGPANAPSPTPDRLYTAVTLIRECRLLQHKAQPPTN